MFPPGARYRNRRGHILLVNYDPDDIAFDTVIFENQSSGEVLKVPYSEAESMVKRKELVWHEGPPPGSLGGGPIR